jgi:hypothetical protein
MAQKTIDFGTVDDVNTIARVADDNIGPGDRTDFFLDVKAISAAHTVDAFVVVIPPPPPVSIDPPGPMVGIKVGVGLAAGQTESLQFVIENDATGVTPAAYVAVCIRTVDGGFPAVSAFAVP